MTSRNGSGGAAGGTGAPGGRRTAGPARVVEVSGRGIPLRGDDIDTDRIIPARFLRCVTFEGLGAHAFADDRESAPAGDPHPFDRPEFQGASILVVNSNFGCGSSREHAPQSLLGWGVRGIVGESFAEIFFGNCLALGVPCLKLPAAAVRELQDDISRDPRTVVTLDLARRQVAWGGPGRGSGAAKSLPASIPDGAQLALVTGTWDSAGLLVEDGEAIDRVAASLPYMADWSS